MPAWKDDFPGSWVEDHLVTRREFTKSLVVVSFATFAGTGGLAFLSAYDRARSGSFPPKQILDDVEAFPPDGSMTFAYPGPKDACLLVRIGRARFAAFGQKCTHLG
jgi:hypothetical protein